jgi:hypothetical protein
MIYIINNIDNNNNRRRKRKGKGKEGKEYNN